MAVEHFETATRLSPQSDHMHYQLQAAYRKESRPMRTGSWRSAKH